MDIPLNFLFLIWQVGFAAAALVLWLKRKHRDYLRLFVLGCILSVVKIDEYIYALLASVFPVLLESLPIFIAYTVIEDTITWTALFYLFAILVRWEVYTSRNEYVFRWLHSWLGIAVVSSSVFLINVVLLVAAHN